MALPANKPKTSAESETYQHLVTVLMHLQEELETVSESIEAIEILLENKRTPTFMVKQLRERLDDAKSKLQQARQQHLDLATNMASGLDDDRLDQGAF